MPSFRQLRSRFTLRMIPGATIPHCYYVVIILLVLLLYTPTRFSMVGRGTHPIMDIVHTCIVMSTPPSPPPPPPSLPDYAFRRRCCCSIYTDGVPVSDCSTAHHGNLWGGRYLRRRSGGAALVLAVVVLRLWVAFLTYKNRLALGGRPDEGRPSQVSRKQRGIGSVGDGESACGRDEHLCEQLRVRGGAETTVGNCFLSFYSL